MTPDWSAAPEAVPYANLADPQSLNLYAYVMNNPVTAVDAFGHCGKGATGMNACSAPGPSQTKMASRVARKKSWWRSLTTFVALGVARISPSAARKIWEAANPGEKVPFDETLGRFYDMAHIKALADGGANEAGNLEPMEHAAHMAQHMQNGDFSRWGARARQDVGDAAQMEEGAIRQSATDAVNDVQNGAEELVQNPAQAVEDVIRWVSEGEDPIE